MKLSPKFATLSCNTGSNSQNTQTVGTSAQLQVHVDYLQGTCRLPNDDWVRECVKAILRVVGDEPIWEENTGTLLGIQWSHRGRSVKGVRWWWNSPSDKSPDSHLMLQLSGRVLSALSVRKVWEMCKFLDEVFSFKATRFDAALDDFEGRISFEEIESAMKARNFAYVNQISPYYTANRDGFLSGWCFYLGSRLSEKYVRAYHKGAEQKQLINWVRFEMQCRDEAAQKMFKEWISIPESNFDELSPKYLAGKIVGVCQFVERKKKNGKREKNVSRVKLLPWWAEFLKAVGSQLGHSVPREDTTFERCKGWVEKQVVKRLAVIREVMGIYEYRKWMDEKMAQAATKFSAEDEAMIVQWSKGQSSVLRQSTGATLIDEDGQKWAWVWRETSQCAEWMLGRFLYETHYPDEARVRFSGESSISVPIDWIHCGKEKPSWNPRGRKMKESKNSSVVVNEK